MEEEDKKCEIEKGQTAVKECGYPEWVFKKVQENT